MLELSKTKLKADTSSSTSHAATPLYVYIVLLLSHSQSVTNHEDNNMFPPDCPHVLHRGEIHQTRFDKFTNKQRRPETEEISVWHRAKEKNGEDGQQGIYQDLSQQVCEDQQTKPKIKNHENADKETFEAERQEWGAL